MLLVRVSDGEESANNVQHSTPVRSAVAVLLIFIECSIAIQKYPMIKTKTITVSTSQPGWSLKIWILFDLGEIWR
jgi:hypothetical protein